MSVKSWIFELLPKEARFWHNKGVKNRVTFSVLKRRQEEHALRDTDLEHEKGAIYGYRRHQ